MIILGLDTATSACAVALWDGDRRQAVATRAELMPRGLAEHLLPMVLSVMQGAGVGFGDIARIGVTIGPGTFTGLRIGLAAARGLALAAQVPLVGVTSLQAAVTGLDRVQRTGNSLLACIESRRDDLFVQAFTDDLQPLGPPADVLPVDLAAHVMALGLTGPLLLVGDAVDRSADALRSWPAPLQIVQTQGGAEALAVARIAAALSAQALSNYPADPFYLRPPDVTLPAR